MFLIRQTNNQNKGQRIVFVTMFWDAKLLDLRLPARVHETPDGGGVVEVATVIGLCSFLFEFFAWVGVSGGKWG